MAEVRVRVETPVLGFEIRSEQVLQRSHLVDAAIEQGRFVVLEELITAEELAAEAALDQGDVDDEPEDLPAETPGDVEVVDEADVPAEKG